MARHIDSRLRIVGTLTALTPLHIGGYGTSPDTDLPLARNGRDEWYVPGTSLAGVLRAWCDAAFGKSMVDKLFGPPMQKGKEDSGHASFILVEDATIENAQDLLVESRDGVGLDRAWGAAADGIKYDRAILPRGTKLSFDMIVELADKRRGDPKSKDEKLRQDETDDEKKNRLNTAKAMIGHLLEALESEKIQFGAARTRGLGRVKFELDPEKSWSQRVNSRGDVLLLLEGKGTPLSISDLKGATLLAKPDLRLVIDIDWDPRLPVMVKAGYEGIGVDILPLVSAIGDDVALVLPGSSIKGALRAQAERIIRTLFNCHAARDASDRQNFIHQIEGLPLIDELFGARGKKLKTRKGLGALSVVDCYAATAMNREAWQTVAQATANPKRSSEEWELRRAIDPGPQIDRPSNEEEKAKYENIKAQRFELAHHNAIDRWTGGASDTALFSVLEPTNVKWEHIKVTLDLGRLQRTGLALQATMLTMLVLRDLATNNLPLGFATNRGLGEIKVNKITFAGNADLKVPKAAEGTDDANLSELLKVVWTEEKFDGLSANLKGGLEKVWQDYLPAT